MTDVYRGTPEATEETHLQPATWFQPRVPEPGEPVEIQGDVFTEADEVAARRRMIDHPQTPEENLAHRLEHVSGLVRIASTPEREGGPTLVTRGKYYLSHLTPAVVAAELALRRVDTLFDYEERVAEMRETFDREVASALGSENPEVKLSGVRAQHDFVRALSAPQSSR